VNETLKSGDLTGDMLQERTVEMTEMAEEAVVAKEARVREELVIKKTAEQRTEDVEDTVRRTEVEVDEGRSGDRPAMGFGRDNNSGTAGSTNDYERANKDRDI
jgi:stress response protein YsnF